MYTFNSSITIPNTYPLNNHLVCFDRIYSQLEALNIPNLPIVDEDTAAFVIYLNATPSTLQNFQNQFKNIKTEVLSEPIEWDA